MSERTPHDMAREFLRALARRRAARRRALWFAAVLRWAGWASLAVLALVTADYFLAFDSAVLAWTGRLAAAAACAALVGFLAAAGAGSLRALAGEVDDRLRDARRPVLTALELGATRPKSDGEAFLVALAVERAAGRLAELPPRATLPLALLRKRALRMVLFAGTSAALLFARRDATAVILARYLDPDADLPPYSRLGFRLQPERPVVVYGDDIELAVEIDGPPVTAGATLLTRVNGAVQRTPCFAEGPRRFGQRLERVTGPVEFCFASGRARSTWHRVEVNLEPRIVLARVAVAPPPYSRKPPRLFTAGEAPLAELAGTRVRLEVTSNRPLKGGEMTITPAAPGATATTLSGKTAGRHVVRFEWAMTGQAGIEVAVTDVQGTPGRTRFRLKQQIRPDEKPRAHITEPGLFSLATPGAALRLAGYAEDDLGVRKLDLVRGLAGYHDRVLPLGPQAETARLDLAQELQLGELGVSPGQTLEFFLEAQDSNPDFTGRGASEVVRVEIISEEEYAQMLRERLDAEQFMERFRQAQAALHDVREKMNQAREALGTHADEAELAARRAALRKAVDQAAEFLRKLATDVPIYEMDRGSQDSFRGAAGVLMDAQKALEQAGADRDKLARALEEMGRKLAEPERRVAEQAEKAKYVTEIAQVLELAQTYRDLLAAQEDLARRYRRHSDPSRITAPAFFRDIEQRQRQVREALTRMRDVLRQRATALPDDEELDDLKDTALEFAGAIDDLEIPGEMQAGEKAAGDRDGRASRDRIERALALMRKLVEKDPPNSFGSACKNRKPEFRVSDEMQKMLNQLGQCRKPGLGWSAGPGWGAGEGAGEGDDGYSAGANTPLNVPLVGPQRAATGGPRGSGADAGPHATGRAPAVAREGPLEKAGVGGSRASDTRGTLRLDDAPEKYRDALKNYFGTMEGGK